MDNLGSAVRCAAMQPRCTTGFEGPGHLIERLVHAHEAQGAERRAGGAALHRSDGQPRNAALQSWRRGGVGVPSLLGGAQVAQHGVAAAAARYGAARSALGLLGPLAWAWLGADLALRALGTDYCRVVRAVFALAQAWAPAPLCSTFHSSVALTMSQNAAVSHVRSARCPRMHPRLVLGRCQRSLPPRFSKLSGVSIQALLGAWYRP